MLRSAEMRYCRRSTVISEQTSLPFQTRPRTSSESKFTRRGSTVSGMLWGVSLVGIGVIIASAVGIGQDGANSSPLDSPAHIASAEKLSETFRAVAKETFPGIVSIETESRAQQQQVRGNLEDLFESDPRFEQFFRNMPELRERFNERPRSAPRQRQQIQRGQGSGFIISKDGHIMTNHHVVSNSDVIKVRLNDGREFQAELVGSDSRSDVAVIKIEAPNLQPVKLGDSNAVEVGDFVLAFGNPFGLEMTMTQGIISAKGRGPGINEREDYLQTDAAINPGNSGGPLVNLKGEVIGVNTAISSRSGGYDGVGFAIPIEMANWSVNQLIKTGQVKRAYIGVHIQPVTSELAERLGVQGNRGAVVTQILPDSPAAKSGLEAGDVIRELDGQAVNGTRALQGIVERLSVGKSYPLLIVRDGKEKTLNVTMLQMPEKFSVSSNQTSESTSPEKSDQNQAKDKLLGLQVQELTPELAQQFGYAEDAKGVVISEVKPGSPAEESGLSAGVLIEKVNQTHIKSVNDYYEAINKIDAESAQKGVVLLVKRGSTASFLIVKVPAQPVSNEAN